MQTFLKKLGFKESDFNMYQLFQIRYGLGKGLPESSVKQYANPRFTSTQMNQMRIRCKS